MKSLVTDLRRVITDHVQLASVTDIISITSMLCGGNDLADYEIGTSTVDAAPRFQVHGDVVNDVRTGLMWSRETIPGGRRKWADAKTAAAAVRIGGHTDWRLPTVRELLTLVDYERAEPSIDSSFQCESAWYWTSTPYKPSPSDCAWVVYFYGGDSGWFYQDGAGFVRAVRPGQLIGSLV